MMSKLDEAQQMPEPIQVIARRECSRRQSLQAKRTRWPTDRLAMVNSPCLLRNSARYRCRGNGHQAIVAVMGQLAYLSGQTEQGRA